MQLVSLLKLAKQMGLDADALIRDTEKEEDQRSTYSFRHPGFSGELEFDLTVELLGKRVTRRAKVVYTNTPLWEYFDLGKQAPYVSCEGSSYHFELAAVSEDQDDEGNATEGKPYWVRMEDITQMDVLPNEVWDAVLDAVDEQCKQEDARRRRAAAIK